VSRPAPRLALFLVLVATSAACDKVALLAPTGSTVTLSISSTSVSGNGTAEVVATVIEAAGTPVHNGTEVTFQSSVGTVDPQVARTESGIARATFRANGASGTANVVAFSGGARSDAVEVRVGSAAAETVTVRATPSTLPQGGGPVQVTASVRDVSGNPLAGAQVVFSADAGTFSSNSAVTDANGEATVALQTTRQTVVTASVAGKQGQVTVGVTTLPNASISLNPPNPVAGQPFQLTVTPSVSTGGSPVQNVIVDFGDGTPARNLGGVTAAQTVSHVYTRPGTYTITVTVVDTAGQRNPISTVVTVQGPVVGVSVSAPPTGDAGQPVSATVTVTNASNIPLTGVRVLWGDGSESQLGPTGGTAQHAYANPGNYTIRAVATDQSGNQFESTQPITIRPRAALQVTLDAAVNDNTNAFRCSATYPKTCETSFSAFVPPPGGQPGVRVVFTAGVTGGLSPAASFQWSFGDGTPPETTTSASRDHLYVAPGTYTIIVRVTTTDGNVGEQRLTLIISL
jgi:PKD repeat protein